MAKAMKLLVSLLLPVACMRQRTKSDVRDAEADASASNSSSAPASFYIQLARLSGGYQKMFCGDNTRCSNLENWPSPDSYVEMEAAKVAEELAKVPDRQRSKEIVRGNDLGFFILNKYLWKDDGKYQTIGLGVSVEDHEYIRPIFDNILHPTQGHWSVADIALQAKSFIEKQQTLDTAGGLRPFMCKLMHKIHLDLDLSDANITEFMAFQNAAVAKMIMPDWIPGSFDTVVATRRKFLKMYMNKMKSDTRGVFPPDMTGEGPGGKMYLVATGLMDSMLFAGGLSVEGLTKTALNVLYSKDYGYLGYDFQGLGYLQNPDNDDVEAFAYEVARLFPAVVGFSWWTPKKDGQAYNGNQGGNHYTHRTVMNLALSLRDPRVWGPKYRQFNPRSVDFYQKHLGNAWALSANEKGEGVGGLGPMSRGCPGKELSMSIVTSFLREWIKQKDKWAVGPGTEKGIKLKDCIPFVSSSFVKFVRLLQMKGSLHVRDENDPRGGKSLHFTLVGSNLRGSQRSGVKDVEYDLRKVPKTITWITRSWRSEYHFEDMATEGSDINCFKMTNTVPWGPRAGKSWEKNKIFCAETSAEKDAWYAVLKGSPFDF